MKTFRITDDMVAADGYKIIQMVPLGGMGFYLFNGGKRIAEIYTEDAAITVARSMGMTFIYAFAGWGGKESKTPLYCKMTFRKYDTELVQKVMTDTAGVNHGV